MGWSVGASACKAVDPEFDSGSTTVVLKSIFVPNCFSYSKKSRGLILFLHKVRGIKNNNKDRVLKILGCLEQRLLTNYNNTKPFTYLRVVMRLLMIKIVTLMKCLMCMRPLRWPHLIKKWRKRKLIFFKKK